MPEDSLSAELLGKPRTLYSQRQESNSFIQDEERVLRPVQMKNLLTRRNGAEILVEANWGEKIAEKNKRYTNFIKVINPHI